MTNETHVQQLRISRSFTMLSGSSAAMILGGAVAVKSFAVLLGPAGVGLFNVLQSISTLATVVAGMGVGAALVQAGANANARRDAPLVEALRYAATTLTAAFGALSFALFVGLRHWVSRSVIGDPSQSVNVIWVGVAVLFTLGWTLDTSILNADQRVRALAKIGLIKGAFAPLLAVAVVWMWGKSALGPALATTAAAGWAASRYFVSKEGRFLHGSRSEHRRAAVGTLLHFGLPFTASTLAGAGVQYVLPILVLHRLGIEGAGYYGAAATIAIGYVGFFLNILSQDYYPRVSAIRDNPRALRELVNEQHRILMLTAVPVVFLLMAVARYLVPLAYTASFSPAVAILGWIFVADVLRFSAWTMSFVVLARNGSLTFLMTELTGGLGLLASAWWGLKSFGLLGIGVAFPIAAVLHYIAVSLVTRREIGPILDRDNRQLLLIALVGAVITRTLDLTGFPAMAAVWALICAAFTGFRGVQLAKAEGITLGSFRSR